MKKYKLTEESIKVNGVRLYRIEALIDFADVKAGDKGGFVQSEENLSHDGMCWVYNNAKVFENAKVMNNAILRRNATVRGNAVVRGNAIIDDNADISGNAIVKDFSYVAYNAMITGNAVISWHFVV